MRVGNLIKILIIVNFIVAIAASIQNVENSENIQTVLNKIAISKPLATIKSASEKIPDIFEKVLEVSQTYKLFKIANITSKIAQHFPAIGLATIIITEVLALFEQETEDRFDVFFKNVFEKFDETNEKLDGLTEKISALELRLVFVASELKFEAKLNTLLELFNHIDATSHTFKRSILPHMMSNYSTFLTKLTDFTKKYDDNNYEYKLVSYIKRSVLDMYSLIDGLAEISQNYERNNQAPIATSSSKIFYDFYSEIMMKVLEGFSLKQLCEMFLQGLTQDYDPNIAKILQIKKQDVLSILINSMIDYLDKVQKPENLNVYIQLGNIREIRLINVLQYFWENEEQLSGSADTCKENCEHYADSFHDGGGGCYGRVRGCREKSSTKQLLQHPQYDRIYKGYLSDKSWFGYGSSEDSPYLKYNGWSNSWFYICDMCKCVCDQVNNPHSIRKIYTEKMEAPHGHVITGVRFTETNHAIFLQVQSGILFPLGNINKSSIVWQPLPSSSDDKHFFYFDFDTRNFNLNEVFMDDHFLTGVQFFIDYNGALTTRIFGKNIESFSLGKMGEEMSKDAVDADKFKSCHGLIPKLKESNNIYTVLKNVIVQFGISNEKEDAGQSFVPYFDGSNVTMSVQAPLSGLGFLHFTNDLKYAGYIKPYIKSLNYRKFVMPLNADDPSLIVDFQSVS